MNETATSSSDVTNTQVSQIVRNIQSKLDHTVGSWFQSERQDSLQSIDGTPFPSDRDELWRYTRPDQFSFLKVNQTLPGMVNPLRMTSFDGTKEVVLKGITLRQGSEIATEEAKVILSVLNQSPTDRGMPSFSNVQLSLLQHVAYLHIAKNTKILEPIRLASLLQREVGAFSSLLVVVVESGADVTFIEELAGDFTGLFMPRIEFILKEDSFVRFISLQRLDDKAEMLARHRIHAHRNAKGQFVHVGIGGAVSRIDLDCRMIEPGGAIDMVSLFVGDRNRHLDFHPTQEHLAPNCRSDLYSKVVLNDESRSVYYGYIRVAEGAQKTDAYQTNRNLLLSPKARADAIPNLEIQANDVKCSHGASVGQPSAEEIFYLQSRGLSRAQAEKLLVEGFFIDALNRIPNSEIREYIQELVIDRLHGNSTRQAL